MAAYQISVPGAKSSREAGRMRDLLSHQATRLKQSGYCCRLEEVTEGSRTVFRLSNCKAEAQKEKGLRQSLGRAVADYFLAVNEPELIRRIITQEFRCQNARESKEIERYAYHLLNDSESEEPSHRKRKDRMARQIAHYFSQHREMAVEGYFRFRMKRYRDILVKLVEHAIDEYLLDQEYWEFIELLRYFVSVQQSKVPLVHVIHTGMRRFRLLDQDGGSLRMKEMDQAVEEIMDHASSHEDLIVSTLLTVAPEKVVLHTRNQEENVIRTLIQVFEDRIRVCDGCSDCRHHLDSGEDGFAPEG